MNREELNDGIKAALKAHDKLRLMTLRGVLAEVKNLEVETRKEAGEQQVNDMIKRVLKQTRETLDGYVKTADDEHIAEYTTRVEVLESLLPEQLSGEALEAKVKEVVEQLGATTKRDMGKVMGALGQATGGNFDKAAAAKIAGSLLS